MSRMNHLLGHNHSLGRESQHPWRSRRLNSQKSSRHVGRPIGPSTDLPPRQLLPLDITSRPPTDTQWAMTAWEFVSVGRMPVSITEGRVTLPIQSTQAPRCRLLLPAAAESSVAWVPQAGVSHQSSPLMSLLLCGALTYHITLIHISYVAHSLISSPSPFQLLNLGDLLWTVIVAVATCGDDRVILLSSLRL